MYTITLYGFLMNNMLCIIYEKYNVLHVINDIM